MSSNKFKFNILTGDNADAKYAALTTKEPYTFYLLQTGKGYLGSTKLFDNSTTQVTGKFFRDVQPHVITSDDLTDSTITKPSGTVVGDSGLIFIADDDNTTDGDEVKMFVPIKPSVDVTGKYFRNVVSYTVTANDLTNSLFSAPSDTKAGDTGLLFTADNNETDDGDEKKYFVPINVEKPDTTTSIDDSTDTTKIPTVGAVKDYVIQMIVDKVSYEIDGEAVTDGSSSNNSTSSSTQVDDKDKVIYSKNNEIQIGTYAFSDTTNKPIYRSILTGSQALTTSNNTQDINFELNVLNGREVSDLFKLDVMVTVSSNNKQKYYPITWSNLSTTTPSACFDDDTQKVIINVPYNSLNLTSNITGVISFRCILEYTKHN